MDFDFWTFLSFVLGFWLGYRYALTSIAYKFYQLAKQHGIKLEEEEKPQMTRFPDCNLEIHNEVMYLFEKNTDTFLCQGNTFEELATKLKNHQGITTAKITVDNKNIYLINGEVKKETL